MAIVGHRGDYKIENTLYGFERAWDNGFKIVECDIRLTKDNVILISHNNIIKTSLGKMVSIENNCYKNIKQNILKNGHKIPTLLDLFKLAEKFQNRNRNRNQQNYIPKIIIEMKTNRREIGIQLAKFLNRSNNRKYRKYIEIVMSFSTGPLNAFSQTYKCVCKDIPVFLLINDISRLKFLKLYNIPYINYRFIDGLYIKFNLSIEKNLKTIMKFYPIGIWGLEKYNYDNLKYIKKLLKLGVKYVNTDKIIDVYN